MVQKLRWAAVAGAVIGFSCAAPAQVRFVTLGIRTHCPYGVRGCWPEIRDGLETPRAIDVICGEPDIRTDTCEVKMRDDWIADPEMFQRNFLDMSIGVDVRGVEATVDGRLEMQGTNLVLRWEGASSVLHLAPLQRKVQWDAQRKAPEAATAAEQKAFAELAAQFKNLPGPVRVVGPLSNAAHAQHRILEVRKFEALKNIPNHKP
ncbi:MAG TPA: hypothetical protein VGF13_02805 [Verrucomicrobiae bacterium]